MSAHANHGYCKGKDIQESLSIEEKKPSIKTTRQKNTQEKKPKKKKYRN
jgi:hypothetical protein